MLTSIRNLIVLLDDKHNAEFPWVHLPLLFPLLDSTSDIYLISEDLIEDTSKIMGIVGQAGDFLNQNTFYRITIHLSYPFSSNPARLKIYPNLLHAIHPFIREGYLHQSVSRLMILPIIKPRNEGDEKALAPSLKFLREQSLTPSIYITEGISPLPFLKLIQTNQERLYLEIGEGSTEEKAIRTLRAHFQFDDLLSWVNTPGKTELPLCQAIIFSEKDHKVYAGSTQFFAAKPLGQASSLVISEIDNILSDQKEDPLLRNIEVLHQLKETLKINNRERESADTFFQLGLECIKRENYRRALEQFEEVLATPGCVDDHLAVLLSKAHCHIRLQDFKSAQAVLNEVEKQDSANGLVYHYRGHLEFELKDYIEAITMFQKSLEMRHDKVPGGEVYFYMGLSHINIMEYDEGLTCLREAGKWYEHDKLSPVMYYMGICYLGQNDIDTAYQFFKKALSFNPAQEDLSSIYLYLGICHKEKGEYQEALSELIKAREAEKDRLEVHNLIGFCYYKLKEYDQAITCFLKAVEINPNSAIDWANLGVNVRAKGEDEKAVILFKKALSLDPTIGFAKKHLKELLEKGKK